MNREHRPKKGMFVSGSFRCSLILKPNVGYMRELHMANEPSIFLNIYISSERILGGKIKSLPPTPGQVFILPCNFVFNLA